MENEKYLEYIKKDIEMIRSIDMPYQQIAIPYIIKIYDNPKYDYSLKVYRESVEVSKKTDDELIDIYLRIISDIKNDYGNDLMRICNIII